MDAAEYRNDLDVRRELQSFMAVLSWTGQAQWREYIEPIDAAFREHTERRDVPLVLDLYAKPGAWWDYRLPAGVPRLTGMADLADRPGIRRRSQLWVAHDQPRLGAQSDRTGSVR